MQLYDIFEKCVNCKPKRQTIAYQRTRPNIILMNAIRNEILDGESKLKKPLETNDVTMDDIIMAIKSQRCLRTKNYDLGNTYLEQQIGNAIRDSIPQRYISYIRNIFGLEQLKEVHKPDPKQIEQLKKKILNKRKEKQQIKEERIKEIQDLSDAKILINLPDSRQSEPYSCGATALQMIMAYYGMNVREQDIIDKMDIKEGSGVKMSNIKKIANEYKFETKQDELTMPDILKNLDKKIPTITAIKKKENDEFHFVIIVGKYNNGLILRDPAKFTYGFISFKELNKRGFRSKNNNFVGLMIFKNSKPKFSDYEVEES